MFLDELDRAIERIGQHPEQYSAYEFGSRRIVLRRFPYLIVFRETASGIEIIAVAHGRRRPGYWRDRFELMLAPLLVRSLRDCDLVMSRNGIPMRSYRNGTEKRKIECQD